MFMKKSLAFLILIFISLSSFTVDKEIKKGVALKKKFCNYVVCSPDKLKTFISDKGMSVNTFVKKNKDIVAAINATFFDKTKKGQIPTGLVLIDGKEIWKSSLDVAAGKCPKRKSSYLKKKARRESKWFYIIYTKKDANGNVSESGIKSVFDFQKEYIETDKYSEIEMALETGPLVLKNKKITFKAFKDRPSRNKKVRRSAIGIKANGDIIMYQSRRGQTFEQLAKSFRKLGAVDAVGLDGGSSCSFATPKTRTKEVKVNTIMYVAK